MKNILQKVLWSWWKILRNNYKLAIESGALTMLISRFLPFSVDKSILSNILYQSVKKILTVFLLVS